MNGREAMVARIRRANATSTRDQGSGTGYQANGTSDEASSDTSRPWRYGRPTPMPDLLGRFVDRVEDYRAVVTRCAEHELGAEVAAAFGAELADAHPRRLAVPEDIPAAWTGALAAAGIEVRPDRPTAPLSHRQLDAVGGVLTGCAVAVAETGTIVLDHGPHQGRRALSLVPDVHVCVVRSEQVVSDVPEAVAAVQESVVAGRPLTWISGPSATSDIELDRVEGVHGPRRLRVILVG